MDAMIAYLNGVAVANLAAPDPAVWDSVATADRDDQAAISGNQFDLTPHLHLLQPTGNVLAIHGLNLNADDLAAMEAAVPDGAVVGDRYVAAQMAHLDSEKG